MVKKAILLALISLTTQTFQIKAQFLRVEGNKILNNKNEPARLRGISLSWSIWQGQKFYNTQVLDWLKQDFKISIIRLSMAVQPAGGYLERPEEQKRLITAMADHAIKNGTYTILDWHDHNAEQHLEQSKKFFTEMAQRYAGSPYIIYEVWNEPEKQSWATVKSYALEVIKMIRQHDTKNLIVVGSPHWDQDVDVVAEDSISGFDNIAYSFHFYASDKSHQDKLRERAQGAINRGLPLFVTEWGVGEANGNGNFDHNKTNTWLKWMEDNKLSWANWNVTDKKETTALLKPGAPRAGNWKNTELTPAGRYIREALKALNK